MTGVITLGMTGVIILGMTGVIALGMTRVITLGMTKAVIVTRVCSANVAGLDPTILLRRLNYD